MSYVDAFGVGAALVDIGQTVAAADRFKLGRAAVRSWCTHAWSFCRPTDAEIEFAELSAAADGATRSAAAVGGIAARAEESHIHPRLCRFTLAAVVLPIAPTHRVNDRGARFRDIAARSHRAGQHAGTDLEPAIAANPARHVLPAAT